MPHHIDIPPNAPIDSRSKGGNTTNEAHCTQVPAPPTSNCWTGGGCCGRYGRCITCTRANELLRSLRSLHYMSMYKGERIRTRGSHLGSWRQRPPRNSSPQLGPPSWVYLKPPMECIQRAPGACIHRQGRGKSRLRQLSFQLFAWHVIDLEQLTPRRATVSSLTAPAAERC